MDPSFNISLVDEANEFFYSMLDSETPLLKKLRVKAAYERSQEHVALCNKFLNPIRENTWMGEADGYEDISLISEDMAIVKYYNKGQNAPVYYYGAILRGELFQEKEREEKKEVVQLTNTAFKSFDEALLGCLCMKFNKEDIYPVIAKLFDLNGTQERKD